MNCPTEFWIFFTSVFISFCSISFLIFKSRIFLISVDISISFDKNSFSVSSFFILTMSYVSNFFKISSAWIFNWLISLNVIRSIESPNLKFITFWFALSILSFISEINFWYVFISVSSSFNFWAYSDLYCSTKE